MSATPQELKSRIEAGIPGAVADVTGDGHHFNAIVSAPAFRGMPRLAQHRLVYDVFGAELGDRIHALSIQTRTSETEDTE
ncbi:MAG TPA: BolA/IbaG family iron-sulfur metabolism protein [Solirubrobacteraceae bacterium]